MGEALQLIKRVEKVGDSRIIYDPTLVNDVREGIFDPDTWPSAAAAPGYSGGRGTTLYIGNDEDEWVLRHYHRGGLTGRWLNDTFLWLGESRSRPYREWLLLERLTALGLPVPRPVAARSVRHGPVYTADLITVRIPDVVPLSTRWTDGPLEPGLWQKIGELIARFHRQAVCHADLTAHNIQINTRDELFLLDFDRGRIMPGKGPWTGRNLARLRRSLRKISQDGVCGFSDREWHWVMSGYQTSL